jgi:hypothetical protein
MAYKNDWSPAGSRKSRWRIAKAAFRGFSPAIAFLFLLGCSPNPSSPSVSVAPQPGNLVYFGVNLDWAVDSPAAFNGRLGNKAAVFVQFLGFPLGLFDSINLESSINMVAKEGGMLMVTLQPQGGLDAVTATVAEEFALRVAGFNDRGVPILIRFAHEMNGSWYVWSQQPTAYIRAFRTLATAIHAMAPKAAMVWAPNYGGGYPFSGGAFACPSGAPDFALLDSDGDGSLTAMDDPYMPYYPGDEAVDWVGMSLYQWGNAYPWGKNEVPEPGKLIAQLTGAYNGLGGDDRSIPDFYQAFSVTHGKPIAIAETAALYNTEQTEGASELALKQAWWRQVFDPQMLADYPRIKMINWFEHRKSESEIGGAVIDWRVLATDAIASSFIADLPVDLLCFADQL